MIKSIATWGRLRFIAAIVLVLGVTYTGTRYQLDWGTLCSYCPVGLLEVALAAKALFLPKYMLLVIPAIALAVVLGRWFCAWGCPSALTYGVFGRKSQESNGKVKTSCSNGGCGSGKSNETSYLTYSVFGGALLASFVVGFPVFCLICPIGLFFGFLFALWKLSTIYQPGWELIIFPAILFLELFLLRSWCSKICPLGMLFSLFGKIGRWMGVAVRPVISQADCLNQQGHQCNKCSKTCPEEIAVSENLPQLQDNCTLCMECYDKCPKSAIKIYPEMARKTLQNSDPLLGLKN